MKNHLMKRTAQAIMLLGLMTAVSATTKAKECPECACYVYCNMALIDCSIANGIFRGCDWNGSECVNQGCDLPG